VGIRAALRYLEEATHNQREIHLFTDLCAHGWQRSEMPSLEKLNVRLVLHDVQREDYPANLAIHQLKIQRDPSALGTFHFAVQVSNNGPGKVSDLPIILSVGKKEIARSFRNLMSGENINVAMTYRIPAEQLSQSENEKIILGKALVRADALPIDDQVYFQLQQRSVVHLLLIDGDPQPNHFFSETFYLAKALTTQSGENAQILSTQITLDEFQPLHLDEKDVVVLTNVRSLTLDRLEALRRFVAQGGGLLIAAGDQVDVDHYNQLFGDLLPAKLRDLRNEEFGISFESLSSEYNQNPIFRSFSEKDRSLFALSKFHRYFVVESKLGDKTEILLRLVSGAPILLGKNYRKGKVALWTSSMDRSWNDFPIQTTFLPFIHSLSFYLSGGNKETQIFEGITGHTVELIVEENIEKVVIQGPQGEIWQEIPERKEDGRRVVEFKEAYSPGHYELQFKASERLVVRKGSLFIHVPLEESQLVKISQKDLYRMIPEEVLELDSLGKGDGPLLVGAAQKTSLTSYVPFLFLSLVGFLFIEALVTSL
jgi:hypothetical protein